MRPCHVWLPLLATLYVLQIGADVVCRDDWVPVGKHCYKFYATNAYTHAAAEAQCAVDGGRLPILDTEEEIVLFKEYLYDKYGTSELLFWIGIQRNVATGSPYMWDNSCPLDGVLDWKAGEPSSNDNEQCVRYKYWGETTGWMWGDSGCMSPSAAVCEKRGPYLTIGLVHSFRASAAPLVPGKQRIEQQVSGVQRIECMAACMEDVSCESFAYNSNSSLCRLMSSKCGGNQHQEEVGWMSYPIREA